MNGQMIAAHEGQTVHNSMIDALVAQEIRRQNDARLAKALAARKRAEDQSELMRAAYLAYWQEKIDDAVALYSWNPAPGPAARLLLGLWALVWWIIGREYRRLSAWNRS